MGSYSLNNFKTSSFSSFLLNIINIFLQTFFKKLTKCLHISWCGVIELSFHGKQTMGFTCKEMHVMGLGQTHLGHPKRAWAFSICLSCWQVLYLTFLVANPALVSWRTILVGPSINSFLPSQMRHSWACCVALGVFNNRN